MPFLCCCSVISGLWRLLHSRLDGTIVSFSLISLIWKFTWGEGTCSYLLPSLNIPGLRDCGLETLILVLLLFTWVIYYVFENNITFCQSSSTFSNLYKKGDALAAYTIYWSDPGSRHIFYALNILCKFRFAILLAPSLRCIPFIFVAGILSYFAVDIRLAGLA